MSTDITTARRWHVVHAIDGTVYSECGLGWVRIFPSLAELPGMDVAPLAHLTTSGEIVLADRPHSAMELSVVLKAVALYVARSMTRGLTPRCSPKASTPQKEAT